MTTPLRAVLVTTEDGARAVVSRLEAAGYNVFSERAPTANAVRHALGSTGWDVVIAMRGSGLPAPADLTTVVERSGLQVALIAIPEPSHREFGPRLEEEVARALQEAQTRWLEREAGLALEEAGVRFQTLFDHAAIGINLGDAAGRCITANPAFRRIVGYSEAELRGKRFAELTAPEDLAADMAQYRRLRAGKIEWYQTEKRYVRKDGSRVWTRVTISLVRDREGNPLYDIAVIEDISSERETRAELEATRTLTSEVVENAQEGIIAFDDALRYTLWNPYMERLTGMPAAEVLGNYPGDLFPHLRETQNLERLQRALAGETVSSPDTQFVVPRTGKSGWVTSTYAPHRNAAGEIVGVIGSVAEITERRHREEELRSSLALLQAVMEGTSETIFVKDLDLCYVMINSAGARQLGQSVAAVIGRDDTAFFTPESAAGIQALDREVIATGEVRTIEDERTAGDVTRTWLTTKGPLRDPEGTIIGVIGISRDITDRMRAEEALRASEEQYRTVVEASLDGIGTVDHRGTITFANAQLARMMGLPAVEALLGRNQLEFIVPEDHERAIARFGETWEVGQLSDMEFTLLRADGTSFPAAVSVSVMHDSGGQPTGITVVVKDVTERKAYEDRLRHQAMHDSLTSLPNRTLFGDRLAQALLSARRTREPLAILLIDLDRFKEVNDTLGHQVGDLLLQAVGERFLEALRESDTVARLGGDEFAVLLTGADEAGAVSAASKLAECLTPPFELNGGTFYLGASIGIAAYPLHGDDGPTLVRRADVAMYTAKRSGTDFVVYAPEIDPNSQHRLAIISGLRQAIEEEELSLHVQPKVHLDRSCADHVEVLARWEHRTHGSVPPTEFIPLAEQTGLIKSLTIWVVNAALGWARRWLDEGLDIEVAVNVSAATLHDPDLVGSIERALLAHDVPGRCLILEITESALMSDAERSLGTVQALHDLGVHVSVDDFGTGYSSLAYLQRLPVDEIKIDRSFVLAMQDSDAGSNVIVRSVIDLGHNLGLQVVAEGVETEEVFKRLRSMGCDLAQGYLLSPPFPAEEFVGWWRRWQAHGGVESLPGAPFL